MIGLQTQQFHSKKENALDNVQSSQRDLVIDIFKKRIPDLKIELQQKNVVIANLHSQLSLKATNNSLSSSVTRNLNDTSHQDSGGEKLTATSYSNAATISRHKNPIMTSSRQQSNNSQINRKVLVAGDLMLNNIHERGYSKQHTV